MSKTFSHFSSLLYSLLNYASVQVIAAVAVALAMVAAFSTPNSVSNYVRALNTDDGSVLGF